MQRQATPMPDDFTVVTDITDLPVVTPDHYWISDAPSLARAADQSLLCAVPLLERPSGHSRLRFYRSLDGGRQWTQLPAASAFHCGRLVEQGRTLYFLGAGPRRGDGIRIIRSDDSGTTWSEPAQLFDGGFYNAASSCAVKDGNLYWCCGAVNEDGQFNGPGSRTVVVAADLERDLTDPAAWRRSNYLTYPGTPPSLRSGVGDAPGKPYPDHWLEGNVVQVKGELRLFWRTRIDEYGTPSLTAVCSLHDDGKDLDYRFEQFYPWPGAQNHFHVIHDPASGLYWMTSNLATHSQDMDMAAALDNNPRFKGRKSIRRVLALFCSFDALNWLPAGYVIVWPLMRQASNYCGLLIDGDDLLVTARTARDAPNQHDNDLITFHRLENFRARAAMLLPGDE